MALSAKKRKLAMALATELNPVSQILEEHNVPGSTYYSRYLKDPDFLEYYQECIDQFEMEVRHVPFTSKRRRLEERYELYQSIPDETIEYWQPTGMRGHNVTVNEDGDINVTQPVRRVWLNIPDKNKILNDFEREMEGSRIAVGPVGSKEQLDLIERRRQADKELEEFEKELEAGPEAEDEGDNR